MRKPGTRIHPLTGAKLRRGERDMTVVYAGMTRTVRVKGWFPDGDGDGLMWRDDGAAADRALAEMKAADARALRRTARRVVKKFHATQGEKLTFRRLSALIMGAPGGLDALEHANIRQRHSVALLLALLDKRPELVREIEDATPRACAVASRGTTQDL